MIGERVADDDGARSLKNALHDAVGDRRLADRSFVDVARGANAKLRCTARGVRARRCTFVVDGLGGIRGRVVEQKDQTFFCAGDVDDGVEHRLEYFVDALQRHQLFAELVELSQSRDRLARGPKLRVAHRGGLRQFGASLGPRCRARFVEHAECELGVTEREAIAVHETRATFFLSVDEDLGLLVDFFEVEIATVEQYLGMRLRDALAFDANVVAERETNRAHRLVQRKNVRRALGRKPLEERQRFRAYHRKPWSMRQTVRPAALARFLECHENVATDAADKRLTCKKSPTTKGAKRS